MAVGLSQGEKEKKMASFQNRGEQLCEQLKLHAGWGPGKMVVKDGDVDED